ncbi:hypothetical protein OY671_012726 [Metschnikowia pulcherrima]|nr:hypothetical protein OY671_012726 [Metschnikowia pulcherrima]
MPRKSRSFGALPERGDVVVFRWPGDASQVWVKRVIGSPGDRIALRSGRLSINGDPVGLRADGVGEAEFVTMRRARDATSGAPASMSPASQVNIRAGQLPPAEANGVAYSRIPLNASPNGRA